MIELGRLRHKAPTTFPEAWDGMGRAVVQCEGFDSSRLVAQLWEGKTPKSSTMTAGQNLIDHVSEDTRCGHMHNAYGNAQHGLSMCDPRGSQCLTETDVPLRTPT